MLLISGLRMMFSPWITYRLISGSRHTTHPFASKVTYSAETLSTHLDDNDLLVLSAAIRKQLEAPNTLKVTVAITSLQAGKTPGPDGLPMEFYNFEILEHRPPSILDVRGYCCCAQTWEGPRTM